MNDVIFDEIAIELTRRCNLKCAHCFKGEAQDVDMPNEIIDAWLDRTALIYSLYLTGGEVTMCPEKMEYILEGLKQRNIPLLSMTFITNGVIQSQRIVDIIRRYHHYIAPFIRPGYKVSNCICVSVSYDDYHDKDKSLTAYDFYKKRLKGLAIVTKHSVGNVPKALGRAKNLPYAIDKNLISDGILKYHKEEITGFPHDRIEYISKDHMPVCEKRYSKGIFNDSQVYIPCSVMLSANGRLFEMNEATSEELDAENAPYICDIHWESNKELTDALDQYNKDKLICNCGFINQDGTIPILTLYMHMKSYADKHPDSVEYFSEMVVKTFLENGFPVNGVKTKYDPLELAGDASLEDYKDIQLPRPYELTEDQKKELVAEYEARIAQ